MSTSRRDFLKFAALLTGATGISGFVPSSIQRAFAIEPTLGKSFVHAEHIVILMQENRSFRPRAGKPERRARIRRSTCVALAEWEFGLCADLSRDQRDVCSVAVGSSRHSHYLDGFSPALTQFAGGCLERWAVQQLARREEVFEPKLLQYAHHHGPLYARGPAVPLRTRRCLHVCEN